MAVRGGLELYLISLATSSIHGGASRANTTTRRFDIRRASTHLNNYMYMYTLAPDIASNTLSNLHVALATNRAPKP